jgi:hypothetical protein
MDQPHSPTSCRCEEPGARYDLFERTFIGVDPADGRYADVAIEHCRPCQRDWLSISVEHEAVSRSGRWARGIITPEQARSVTPETAIELLHGLDWYTFGGSYFDGQTGRKSGPMGSHSWVRI